MSQTKQWSANLGNVRRTDVSSGTLRGAGGSTRFYVGRHSGNQYKSFVRFALDWTDVGKIVSATLHLYTDDGLGAMESTDDEHPKITVRRATDAFSEFTNNDSFVAADVTDAAGTSSDQRVVTMDRSEFGLTDIDITAIVEDWAPSTVKRRNGLPGGKATNYGLVLLGSSDADENWSGWSEDYSDGTYRPTVTLTYEYAPTAPDAPTNMTPTGAVLALDEFEGDFVDVDADDVLQYSHVQVYGNSAVKSGTAAADNNITVTAHGYAVGKEVWFHSLTGGAGLSLAKAYFVKSVTTNTFKVAETVGGTAVDITDSYSALTVAGPFYSVKQRVSATEAILARFSHVPDSLTIAADTNYKWRARVFDQDGSISAWAALVQFSVTNTAPTAPTTTPVEGSTRATLDGVLFRGGFHDADAGDKLLAFEVQFSAYPEGDARWLDDEFILWNTGKVYVPSGATTWSRPYGGGSLDSGTYYWRARVYDNHHTASAWTYHSIIVSTSFEAEPGQTTIQRRPRAPWRIVIKDMLQTDGVTRTVGRGPGNVVAIIEDAKNVGASLLFNSPGELHFTLKKDHPQISVIEPKQTHYSVQFRQGDGWREVFAGLMWDFDATDTDIVLYGIDYMALLDYVLDERYDSSNPDKAAEKGGSKYVTSGKNSIGYITYDQLYRAKNLPNSPIGFISIAQSSATLAALMSETVTVFSTYAFTLPFVTGLMDSHRAGTGKKTRLSVRQTTLGGYEFFVEDDPGSERDDLRLRYGELVQGYRVIPFGDDWASRLSAIGRSKDGIRVMYKTKTAPGIDEAVWGRFTRATFIDGVADENDLTRRTAAGALKGGKLGKNVAIGIRSGMIQPRDGWDLMDQFPVDIEDGSVSTDAFGSGYWVAVGVTWTADAKTGKQDTTLTLSPREDSTPPDSDLLTLQPISPQAEWQIGWTTPNPLNATSKYWLDQSTGKVYLRTDGATIGTITGDV